MKISREGKSMNVKNKAEMLSAIPLVAVALVVTWALGHANPIKASIKAEPAMLLPGSCGACIQHSGMLPIASLQTARINVVNVRIQVIPLRLT
jgi:hypothetical protein